MARSLHNFVEGGHRIIVRRLSREEAGRAWSADVLHVTVLALGPPDDPVTEFFVEAPKESDRESVSRALPALDGFPDVRDELQRRNAG